MPCFYYLLKQDRPADDDKKDDPEWQADVFYSIQVLDEGKWYTVPFSPQGLYGGSDFQLFPGQTYHGNIDLAAFYGELPDGSYRWEECSNVYCPFMIRKHKCILQ